MENKDKKCSCNYCESELVNSCMSPQFCKPCSINKGVKICKNCGVVFGLDYDKCPSCGSV
ncbi:MAG: hypothetical protein LBT79_06115 [Elusimicrobiota bacterium]|nr:hypothetical protein [Elusimicrobiota bacterium]